MRCFSSLLAAMAVVLIAVPAHADRPEFEPYLSWDASAGLLADVDQDATSPNGRAGVLLDAQGAASGGTFLPNLTLGDQEIAFFGFTALGAGVDARFDGELELCEGCDGVGEVVADAEVFGRILWVDVLYGESFQRPVEFDSGYWRSEAGLAGRSVGLRFPGIFNMKSNDYKSNEVRANFIGGEVRRRELFDVNGPSWAATANRVEDQYEWAAYGGHILFDYPHMFFELDFVRYSSQQWTNPTPVDSSSFFPFVRQYAPGAQFAGRFELDLFDLELDVEDAVRLKLNFGLSSMTPLGIEDIYVAEGDMRYKGGLQLGRSLDVSPIAGRWGFNVGVVSFHRLDPSGLAVDAGPRYLVEGAVRVNDRIRLDASGTVVTAWRRMVSPYAEPGDLSIGEGDAIIMARGQVEGSWAINDWLSATSQVWAERSDRTDPLTFASGPGVTQLRGGFGAWLGLRATFDRPATVGP